MELPEMPDDEVEARLADLQGRPVGALPSFDEHLDSLEGKAMKARGAHQRTQNAEPSKIDGDRRASKGLGIGLAMAYTMIGLPLLGIVLGFLLNKVLPGPWIAVGVVGGFVAGVAFALYLGNRERDSF